MGEENGEDTGSYLKGEGTFSPIWERKCVKGEKE